MSNPPDGLGPGGFPLPPNRPPDGDPPYPDQPPGDPLVPTDLNGWFGRWIRVFRRSFWRLSLITLIVGAVLAAVAGAAAGAAFLLPGPWSTGGVAGPPDTATALVMSGAFLIAFLIGYTVFTWGQGASLYVAVMDAAGRHAGVGEALRWGARRALPLAAWYLVGAVAVMIGILLLILPGLYLAVVLNASLVCAVVIERDGPGRCFELIRHRFWATLGRLVLGWLVIQAYEVVLPFVLISPFVGAFALSPPDSSGAVGTIVIFLLSVVAVAAMVLPVVVAGHAMTIVTYAELRGHENRGITTDRIADELARP
ncbi:hypothetical protein [Pseudonocardia adelaidensis]|uniref:Glycerophosphoryl diester phosphodiesterase family protein n=1 Tax=Pseudonocardia adelaidensis TaxID=648754 RepID=A0ABP9NPD1_9PSEU